MSTEIPTRPLSNIIIRIIVSVAFIALAYYGYRFGASHQGVFTLMLKIISALGCFIGLVAFYRSVMELINKLRTKKPSA